MGVLLAVSAFTRLYSLSTALPDFDEAVSWYHVESVLLGHGFWSTFAVGIDAPLYPTVNLLVVPLLGSTVHALRVPAALFGIGSVLLFYGVVRRLHSRRVAFLSASLVALSPFFIFYAKSARPYSQMLFFSLLFTWAFFATATWRPFPRAAIVSALTVLAVASQYYAIVYLASFYLIVLADHLARGRLEHLQRDFRVGAVSLVCIAPLLWALARALNRMPVRYWEPVGINLATVTLEQLLFTGSLGTEASRTFLVVSVVVFALLLLPLVAAATGHVPWPRVHPLLLIAWLVPPLLVVGLDLFVGGKHLFFPRGFIASAPFLFSYLVIFALDLPASKGVKVGAAALFLVPFALDSYMVVVEHPEDGRYAYRSTMPSIVEEVRRLDDRFDLVVTHHWFVAPYFTYFFADREGAPVSLYYEERKRVVPAGMWRRELALERGEPAAAIADVDALPADARVLVLVNSLASRYADPDGELLRHLQAERPLELRRPCLPEAPAHTSFLCEELFLFGAKRR